MLQMSSLEVSTFGTLMLISILSQPSMLEWHMQSRKFSMTAIQLERLQQKSIEVLDDSWSPSSQLFPRKTVLPMAGNLKISSSPSWLGEGTIRL
jgi:hypothetical protein